MSKRILMRLGKDPFERRSAWENLEGSFLGANNGNLIFGYAAHKLLSVAGTEVDANHYRIHPNMAARVNDEYDGFVLPLANAFRPSFRDELRRTTAFIEKLKIPFMMLSGGAQLPHDGDPSSLDSIKDDVKSFARAVLDHSPALSVRGARTAEYLATLGISDVEVVGCPSLTLHGPGHRVEGVARISRGAKVAYNIETSRDIEPTLFARIDRDYDAVYFPQDQKTLEGMLWGTDPYAGRDPALPLARSHPQFQSGKAEFWFDAPAWINRLKDFELSIGSRIHGNIASILAGTPAVLLAHDSRTLELAEHHQIPVHRVVPGRDAKLSVDDLLSADAFDGFNRVHTQNFERMSDFVHRCGFKHIHEASRSDDRADYEIRVASASFSEPARHIVSTSEPDEYIGPRILRERSAKALSRLRELGVEQKKAAKTLSEYKRLKVEVADLREEHRSVLEINAALRADLETLRLRIERLETGQASAEEIPRRGFNSFFKR